MKLPRCSIRTMVYLVLVAALDLAWAPNIWKMQSVFGFRWHCIDLPVLGMANVLALSGGIPLVGQSQRATFQSWFRGLWADLDRGLRRPSPRLPHSAQASE